MVQVMKCVQESAALVLITIEAVAPADALDAKAVHPAMANVSVRGLAHDSLLNDTAY